MDTGTTQRPPAYAELLVNSLDRYNRGFPDAGGPTTSSDWTTKLQQIVLNGYFTRLAVTQVQFWWNLATIMSGYNDTFSIDVTAGAGAPRTITATLQGGYYTPDALAAEIEDALVAADAAGWTVAFTNGVFSIQGTGLGYTWEIALPTNNIQARTLNTLGLINTGSGFALNATFFGSPPSMVATRYIDICSSTLTKFQRVKDSTTLKQPTISNIIARIYPCPPNTLFQTTGAWTTAVTELPGNSIGSHPFVLCIDYNTPKYIKWDPNEALSNFDLQLRDEFGELIPFFETALCEYQLTILATES
jgi:hypothetical protein